MNTLNTLKFVEQGRYMKIPSIGIWSRRFRFGTCQGLFYRVSGAFCLLAVVNDEPHNGHFDELMNYLEERGTVRVISLLNPQLRDHLIFKRGYILSNESNLQRVKMPSDRELVAA